MKSLEFHSTAQFIQCVNEAIELALDDVAAKSVERLTQYISENWYEKYSPKDYQRTFEFLKSIAVIKARMVEDGSIETEIYFNTDKINAHVRKKGLNAHASFSGKDVSQVIPEWLELGNSNIVGRKDTVSSDGLHSLDALVKWLSGVFVEELAKALKKHGINIK